MNSHFPKILLAIALLGLSALASCSRDEPPMTAPVVVVPGEVMLNEAYSRGGAGMPGGNLDWVEIHNPSSLPIDIGGYLVYDPGGNGGTKPKKAIPAGTIVPAHGYYVVVTDSNTSSAVLDGFGLSSGGDEVWLENASGAVVDYVAILAMDVAQSYGRYPNGDSTWQLLNTITKGAANQP